MPDGPAYRILTPRLLLRCWEPSDAEALKRAIDENLEHLRPWMPWVHEEPQPLNQKVKLLRTFRARFDSDEDFTYGFFAREGAAVLGSGGLHTRQGPGSREVGYWIDHRHIGRGLALEAAAALVRVAFEVDEVERVEIRVDPSNEPSIKVVKKLAFPLEATLRRRLPGGRDANVYTMFRSEYSGTPASQAELEAYDALGRRLL